MHQVLNEKRNRNKVIPVIALILIAIWGLTSVNSTNSDSYSVGKVTSINSEGVPEDGAFADYTQDLEVEINGSTENIEHSIIGSDYESRKLKPGQKVVIESNITKEIIDNLRVGKLLIAFLLFALVAVAFGGIEAAYSLLGLAFSTIVVLEVILKNILNGADPFLVTILGGTLIAVFSVYMAHGIKRRTTIAVVSILITMLISIVVSKILVNFADLFGLGTEDAFYLITDPGNSINLQGILLAGIIIGTIGVLDDITTSQAAAVDEIYKANPKLKPHELYKRGTSVGKEHISSLINTLFLAYVGVSLPLLIVFIQGDVPIWVLLNSEAIAEEVVRTIVGSTALVLAVPITTLLASRYVKPSK